MCCACPERTAPGGSSADARVHGKTGRAYDAGRPHRHVERFETYCQRVRASQGPWRWRVRYPRAWLSTAPPLSTPLCSAATTRLGMNPWAYFRDVLPKLGDTCVPASRLEEFLPEAWAQQQAQQR